MSEHVFTIHVKPAEDLPGQWVGHCLELDVVSQGNDMVHALEMTAEASAMVLRDDMEQDRDPFERGPVEAWTGKRKPPEPRCDEELNSGRCLRLPGHGPPHVACPGILGRYHKDHQVAMLDPTPEQVEEGNLPIQCPGCKETAALHLWGHSRHRFGGSRDHCKICKREGEWAPK